jgi:hypothetical protein
VGISEFRPIVDAAEALLGNIEGAAEPVVAEACCSFASLAKNPATPLNRVGLGGTALTVTPVPATVSAKPREIASCAVSVVDHLPLEY